MTKFNKIFLAIAAVAVMSVSCSKDYLNTKPTNSVSETDILNTVENSYLALNGIHRCLHNSVGSSWNSQGSYPTFCLHLNAMDDDWVFTYDNVMLMDDAKWVRHRDLTHKYKDIKYYWYTFYKVISNANKIITVIDDLPDAKSKESLHDYIKGQSLAYRAFAHHILVQTWAQRYDWNVASNDQMGVVVRLDNNNDKKARATVEATYKQINDDLDAAIALLEKTSEVKANKSHIDQWVAKGFKVRVLMCQGKYKEAGDLAADIVKNCGAKLSATTYTDGMAENRFGEASNTEWMWACLSSRTDGEQFDGSRNWHDLTSNNNCSYNKNSPRAINCQLFWSIPETDVRKAIWIEDPWKAASAGKTVYKAANTGSVCMFMSQKFLVDDPSTTKTERDVPYMRLPEIILNAAEAYARCNENGKAEDYLLMLAQNRDASYTLDNGAVYPGEEKNLINQIMWQKRVELWGEMGFRWFDLKRLNLPLDRGKRPRAEYNQGNWLAGAKSQENLDPEATNYAMYGVTFPEEALYLPAGNVAWQWLIPNEEIDSNPDCKQNPLL